MSRTICIFFLCAGLLCACDDSPSVPPEVLDQVEKTEQEAQAKNKRPTTQQLLTGPRSRTALMPLPLTMDLPPGWGNFAEMNKAAGLALNVPNMVQGYTPNGTVEIELRARSSIKQEDLDRMLEAGRKEMQEKPQQILKTELRDHGEIKLLERQKVGEPAPLTTYDKDNRPHTTTEAPFSWVISALVPSGDAYQVYELSFMGLTKSQFDKDKDFLNSILNTLSYGASSTPPPTTSPSAAPAAAPGPV